jgi:hypothetical protein
MRILGPLLILALSATAGASQTVLQCSLAVGPITQIKVSKNGNRYELNQVRFSGEQNNSVLSNEEWENQKIYLNTFDANKSEGLLLFSQNGAWFYHSLPGASIEYMGQADCSPFN